MLPADIEPHRVRSRVALVDQDELPEGWLRALRFRLGVFGSVRVPERVDPAADPRFRVL